jgi:hypothetical protein
MPGSPEAHTSTHLDRFQSIGPLGPAQDIHTFRRFDADFREPLAFLHRPHQTSRPHMTASGGNMAQEQGHSAHTWKELGLFHYIDIRNQCLRMLVCLYLWLAVDTGVAPITDTMPRAVSQGTLWFHGGLPNHIVVFNGGRLNCITAAVLDGAAPEQGSRSYPAAP